MLAPPTSQHEHCSHREQDNSHQGDDAFEEELELLGVEFAMQVIHKGVDLAQAEHPESRHVLGGLDGLWGERRRERWRESQGGRS